MAKAGERGTSEQQRRHYATLTHAVRGPCAMRSAVAHMSNFDTPLGVRALDRRLPLSGVDACFAGDLAGDLALRLGDWDFLLGVAAFFFWRMLS